MGRRANKAFAGDFGGARGKFGGEYQAWVAAPLLAPETCRVCQAWHVASEVQVLTPGIRRAEG